MRRTYGSLLLVAWAVCLLAAGGSPARAGNRLSVINEKSCNNVIPGSGSARLVHSGVCAGIRAIASLNKSR